MDPCVDSRFSNTADCRHERTEIPCSIGSPFLPVWSAFSMCACSDVSTAQPTNCTTGRSLRTVSVSDPDVSNRPQWFHKPSCSKHVTYCATDCERYRQGSATRTRLQQGTADQRPVIKTHGRALCTEAGSSPSLDRWLTRCLAQGYTSLRLGHCQGWRSQSGSHRRGRSSQLSTGPLSSGSR